MSLAARTALDLALWPRESRAGVLPSDPLPPVAEPALWGFDEVRTAEALVGDEAWFRAQMQGSFPDPVRSDGGTFSNAPAATLTVDALNAAMEALRDNRVALPRTTAMSPRLYAEMQRFSAGRGDDMADALVGAWQAMADAERRIGEANARERERARLRAAQYEREAPWRARILASIPAPRHITAAELRARVVLPTLRERLGLVTP